MTGRTLRDALSIGIVSLFFAGPVLAHDPDWKPEAGGDPKAAPEAASSEKEKWPDPYLEERKWGPVHLGAAAGAFVPWQGNFGHAVTGHALVSSPTGHVRLGAEVLYRSYESRIFDVNDVDVDSYEINFVFQYHFNPEGISPYLGAVTGLQINKIRKTEVQDQRRVRVTDDVGAGWGLAILAGLEIPLMDHLALYGEARAGIAYQGTSRDHDHHDRRYGYNRGYGNYDTEDLGGATGVLGVRYHF